MQAVRQQSSVSPKVIAFPASMAKRKPRPDPLRGRETPQGFHPPTHGNWAQWAAVIASVFALAIGGLNTYLIWSGRNVDHQAKVTDEHVNGLISAKLNPAVQEIENNISISLNPITTTLNELNTRVSKLEGRFEQLDAEQKKLAKLQLDRLSSQIAAVRRSGRRFDPATVRILGDDLVSFSANPDATIHQSAWRVTNELLSYYSFGNEVDSFTKMMEEKGATLLGIHRDDECALIGRPENTPRIFFRGIVFKNCTVHLDKDILDKNAFEYVLFKNVTVVYAGGPLRLKSVAFVDCIFDMKLTDPSKKLAETLLASNRVENLQLP